MPWKKLYIAIGVLALVLFVAGNAGAFIGECEVSLDNETIGRLADDHVIRVKDGVFHKPLTVDLGDETLATLKPGDLVTAHGEEHIVLQISERTLWTQFIFINRQDLRRFEGLLGDRAKGGRR